MKIGIRITLTQVEDDMIHELFEIYNVQLFNEIQNPKEFKEYLESLKIKSGKLASGDI